MSVSSGFSPAVSTMTLEGSAVGKQAHAVFDDKPHVVEQPIGLLEIEPGPGIAKLGAIEGRCGKNGVLPFKAEAEVDDLVDLPAVDGQRKGAPEAEVPQHRAPHRIGHVEIGIEGKLAPPRRLPQPYPVVVVFLSLLEKGVVVEGKSPHLKVGFPRPSLERDELAVDDGHDNAVHVGELPAPGVHLVIEGIALADEPLGRSLVGNGPWLQGGKVGVVEAIEVVEGVVERCPARFAGLGGLTRNRFGESP